MMLHTLRSYALRLQLSHSWSLVVSSDTMVETAQYIQTRLVDTERLSAVIAFTGATKPERFVDSDASFNVGLAVGATSICSPGSVVICMNGNVIPADQCVREEESGLYLWK